MLQLIFHAAAILRTFYVDPIVEQLVVFARQVRVPIANYSLHLDLERHPYTSTI